MPLLIQTTGLEDYAPGGKARVKVLVIGGPGAGKTRWASYFPKPIYADCEGGLASVADRKVPYVGVNSSQDMLDLLAFLKQECRQPAENRTYDTIVIDTLDAFQRKVKNEWMEKEKKQVFTGWEAWGFLNSKMQMLMTRLLNLDMNVIVTVHYKDKTTTDDETGKSTHTLMLQLQGELSDTAFNDFDLVAWMGTFWQADNGERVQKRGLTFKPTPEKPFLKDRLHVTPDWLEVDFAPTDYSNLFDKIQARVAEMETGTVVGEVPSEAKETPPSGFVIPPGAAGTGALAPVAPKDVPLAQLDKPTLIKLARDTGITTIADGSPIRGNTLKAELIATLEAHRAATAAAAAEATPTAGTEETTPDTQPQTSAATPDKEPAALPTERDAPQAPSLESSLKKTEQGIVDTATGELVDRFAGLDEMATAVDLISAALGGEVVDEAPAPEPEPPATPPAPPSAGTGVPSGDCEDCGKSLAQEKPDFVKLAYIKYRKKLCEDDYQRRKSGAVRV